MTNANDLIQFNMDSSLANGLTKREHFASNAMTWLLASGISIEEAAEQGVKAADALINELNQTNHE